MHKNVVSDWIWLNNETQPKIKNANYMHYKSTKQEKKRSRALSHTHTPFAGKPATLNIRNGCFVEFKNKGSEWKISWCTSFAFNADNDIIILSLFFFFHFVCVYYTVLASINFLHFLYSAFLCWCYSYLVYYVHPGKSLHSMLDVF